MHKKKFLSLLLCTLSVAPLLTPVSSFAAETNVDETVTVSEDTTSTVDVTVNSYDSVFGVRVPKKMSATNMSEGTLKYDVAITDESDLAGSDVIKVVPDEEITFSQLRKSDRQAFVSQSKTEWYADELDAVADGDIAVSDLTVGKWSSTLTFNISLEKAEGETLPKEPEVTEPVEDEKDNLPAIGTAFNDMTWEQVNLVCEKGLAKDYFKAGDVKTIDIASFDAQNYLDANEEDPAEIPALLEAINNIAEQEADVTIVDITEDGKNITCWISSYQTTAPTYMFGPDEDNEYSWENSSIREWLNTTYLDALPSDLQDVISIHETTTAGFDDTEVSYVDDNLYLFSVREVYGDKDMLLDSSLKVTNNELLSTWNAEKAISYFNDFGVLDTENGYRYWDGLLRNQDKYMWLRSTNAIKLDDVVIGPMSVAERGLAAFTFADSSLEVYPAFVIGE